MTASSDIRTRFLIISDTHGHALLDPARDGPEALKYGFRRPLPSADVALHCGDLTTRSTPQELETTLNIMREIDAPLKLVIPGNHDSNLDLKFCEDEYQRKQTYISPTRLATLRRIPQECFAVIQKARQQDNNNLHVLLEERIYHFILPHRQNAKLTIFTSPWTPEYGRWGFQYEETNRPGAAHHFGGIMSPIRGPEGFDLSIRDIDVVMTHGPPYGVLDDTRIGTKAGSRHLLNAVARGVPKLHCFGHIHEGAGATLIRWGVDDDDAGVLNGAEVVTSVAAGSQLDERDGSIRPLDICAGGAESGAGDRIKFEPGKETLFVNAAIMTVRYQPLYSPWLVDLDLGSADEAFRAKAEETRVFLTS